MNSSDLRNSISTTIKYARSAAPAAALASSLLGPAALGAPGDLDPSFADVGRAYSLLDLDGPAWSIETQGDDDYVFSGGDFYESFYYESYYISGFAHRLSGNGSIDQTFAGFNPAGREVLDTAVAADGSVIGVGRELVGSERTVLLVFRLDPDGVPDPAFGEAGVARLFPDAVSSAGSSVVLESDGSSVVAGVRDGRMIVSRLRANGTLDPTFADSGVYSGPTSDQWMLPTIVRAAGGGYRVTSQDGECHVLALTASGSVDESFGTAGLAALGEPSTCSSTAVQEDGRLLLAGHRGSEGFATRLLASGRRDETFEASAVAASLRHATALEVSEGGSIIVAGRGAEGQAPGGIVMRLHASGALDTTFGNGGSTVIDLPSGYGTWPTVRDITVQGGKVLVAGDDGGWPLRPFIARLLADTGTDGPGVLGLTSRDDVDARERDGAALVTVQRTGGRAGRVSVLLKTRAASSFQLAEGGEDYATTERTLTWEDGDAVDQQVVIPILPDAPGAAPEEGEFFEAALSEVQGGAGLGTQIARVAIAPDGEPGGQFSITGLTAETISESGGSVSVRVARDYYYDGAVSVTVSPVAGTAAAGEDFAGDPITLTWADGEGGGKNAHFVVHDDNVAEGAEQFSVQLSAPTGGAVVGPRSAISYTIDSNDQPRSSKSGGGGIELLSLLLLGLAGWMRSASQWPARLCRFPGAKAARPLQGERLWNQSTAALNRRGPSGRTAP